jgi:hypothetical protein
VGAKSTMGIRNFNLRRCQVRKWEKIGLNQSLIYIQPFPHTLNPNFLVAPLQLGSQNKLLLGRKNIGGAFAPPTPLTQVTAMRDVTEVTHLRSPIPT